MVKFIRGCWVHSLAQRGSFGSSGVVVFTRVRPVGPLDSSGVVGLTCVCPGVHLCAHCGSFGSSEFVGFTRATWCSLGSFRVIEFTLVRSIGIGAFIRGRWVHTRAPWGSLDSSVVVGFTRTLPVGRWDHSWSLGSLVHPLGVVR